MTYQRYHYESVLSKKYVSNILKQRTSMIKIIMQASL